MRKSRGMVSFWTKSLSRCGRLANFLSTVSKTPWTRTSSQARLRYSGSPASLLDARVRTCLGDTVLPKSRNVRSMTSTASSFRSAGTSFAGQPSASLAQCAEKTRRHGSVPTADSHSSACGTRSRSLMKSVTRVDSERERSTPRNLLPASVRSSPAAASGVPRRAAMSSRMSLSVVVRPGKYTHVNVRALVRFRVWWYRWSSTASLARRAVEPQPSRPHRASVPKPCCKQNVSTSSTKYFRPTKCRT